MEGRGLEGFVGVGVGWLPDFGDVGRKNLVIVCKRDVEL